ncbi:MAG: hypothetical protein AB7R89_06275 [Dehalococcoidia bacterium]
MKRMMVAAAVAVGLALGVSGSVSADGPFPCLPAVCEPGAPGTDPVKPPPGPPGPVFLPGFPIWGVCVFEPCVPGAPVVKPVPGPVPPAPPFPLLWPIAIGQ